MRADHVGIAAPRPHSIICAGVLVITRFILP
jgi:hypothetical protein